MLSLFKSKYIARRYGEQTFVNGYETSPHTDFAVWLNVQPLTSGELQALPEGERSIKRYKAFGGGVLKSADVKAGTKGDLVFYDGEWYEVRSSNQWRHISILAHNYTELVLVDKRPEAPDMEVLLK